jgi:hypothetical protein
MSLKLRTVVVMVGLLLVLATQIGLRSHFESAGPLETVPLAGRLADVPMTLGLWRGADRPEAEMEGLYGDEKLKRFYHHPSGQTLALWASYSKLGEDRGHHPEVCMKTAGKNEDIPARRICPVDGPGDAVQQYRFVGPLGDSQWVFYWHYTLPSPENPDLTSAQLLYQRLRRRPSSMTVEVFAPEGVEANGELAREFVRLADAELRKVVGPDAIRGSERLAVTLVDPEAVPEFE